MTLGGALGDGEVALVKSFHACTEIRQRRIVQDNIIGVPQAFAAAKLGGDDLAHLLLG